MLAELATTLLAANRVIAFEPAEDGYVRSWRPNPSAGGRHPCDLLVDAHAVDGLLDGLYWFDAFGWSLRPEPDTPSDFDTLRVATRLATGLTDDAAATVYLFADFARTGSWYAHPASLVWRDAGALIVTLQLAAFAAGLSSCAAGNAGELELADGSVNVGALILGPATG